MSPTNMRKPCERSVVSVRLHSWDGRSSDRLEGLDLGLLAPVVDRVLHVVDGETTLGLFELVVAELRDTLVAPVLGAEIEDRSPVVGEVFAKLASRAG